MLIRRPRSVPYRAVPYVGYIGYVGYVGHVGYIGYVRWGRLVWTVVLFFRAGGGCNRCPNPSVPGMKRRIRCNISKPLLPTRP